MPPRRDEKSPSRRLQPPAATGASLKFSRLSLSLRDGCLQREQTHSRGGARQPAGVCRFLNAIVGWGVAGRREQQVPDRAQRPTTSSAALVQFDHVAVRVAHENTLCRRAKTHRPTTQSVRGNWLDPRRGARGCRARRVAQPMSGHGQAAQRRPAPLGTPARRVRPREWAFREEHGVDRGVLRGFKRLPLTLSGECRRKRVPPGRRGCPGTTVQSA